MGSIVLLHETDWQSRAIQIATRSHWNHVALFTAGGIVEALSSGVVLSPFFKYQNHPGAQTVRVDAPDWPLAEAYALSRVGRRYNRTEIASQFCAQMLRSRFYFGIEGEDICSGLVGEALERAGLSFPVDGERMTPGGLAAFFGVVPA
jgi:uncharacterized protein YycO